MSDEEDLNAAERELEAALGALSPSPPAIDRDRMMFQAGQRSARPQRRPILWQALSGALAAALLLSVSLQRAPRYVERVVHVRTAATTPDPDALVSTTETWDLTAPSITELTPPASSYLILRKRVLSDYEIAPAERRRAAARSPTGSAPKADLPFEAGFFGRVSGTSPERL